MPTYKAHILDAQGKNREELVEAPDKMAAYELSKAKGETLITAEEYVKGKGLNINIDLSFFSRVSLKDKYIFARNLGGMLEAGLPLSRALSVIEKQSKKKKFKDIVSELNSAVAKGKTLSDAMVQYPRIFPPIMVSMVHSGEESGSLAKSLRIVANQMESTDKLVKKIKGAMMYPAVILVAIIAIGIFMLISVVPTLSQTFKEFDTELPASTRFVLFISDLMQNHFIVMIAVILLFGAGIFFGLRTIKGKKIMNWLVLRIPVVGPLVKEVNSARTARTFSSLLSAGVDVVTAAKITEGVIQNVYFKEVLMAVGEKVQKGEAIAEIFHKHEDLYPSFVGEMVAVGEETGQLSEMLLGVAVFYEEEVEQKTKDMTSIIEPFLMIIIGLAVGFFALSMISPIYSLTNAIK